MPNVAQRCVPQGCGRAGVKTQRCNPDFVLSRWLAGIAQLHQSQNVPICLSSDATCEVHLCTYLGKRVVPGWREAGRNVLTSHEGCSDLLIWKQCESSWPLDGWVWMSAPLLPASSWASNLISLSLSCLIYEMLRIRVTV